MAVTEFILRNVDTSQTSEQMVGLPERMNHALLKIIRDNLTTPKVDTTLLADFRAHVPLSDYAAYKPFIDKFNVEPCKEEDVVNMLSPGLPDFFALSSGTSGMGSKMLPKYNHAARLKTPTRPRFDPNNKGSIATLSCTGYRDVKVIECSPGEVVRKIPVCIVTGGYARRSLGRYIDDESQMFLAMSGYAAPWAATVIGHFPSFLTIHGLFFLAHKNVYKFQAPFVTHFVDLIPYIDEHWDLLVSCIRDGIVPDLEGIDPVRKYLQAHLHPNPERATELLEIGPPFSSGGWVYRVWPMANELCAICSGPFAILLPKVRSILGPNVPINCPGYGSSEATIGVPYGANKLDEFILQSDGIVEFLDVTLHPTHENLRQAWEVEVGKEYEPILTTRDGLWRYRLGDVLRIIGFDTTSGSPLFKYSGRRIMSIRLPGRTSSITDDQLVAAIQAFSSDDGVLVQEFTTMIDDRELLPTVGFFIELAGPLGPNTHLASQKLFEGIAVDNSERKRWIETGRIRLPTIRIVKAGTFSEYRQWKGKNANIPSGQIKVPVVLFDPTAQEWILERVVQEL